MKANVTEPKERIIQYQQTIYLCANGNHDCNSVYLWHGKWYCGTCLKAAVRKAGGSSQDVYNCMSAWSGCDPKFKAQAFRRASPLQRMTPRNKLPKQPRIRTEYCETCESTHKVGFCPL